VGLGGGPLVLGGLGDPVGLGGGPLVLGGLGDPSGLLRGLGYEPAAFHPVMMYISPWKILIGVLV